MYFRDLNPNSYDNLNNMKLDLNCQLNVATKRSNLASANDQGLLKFKSQKSTHLFVEMKPFACEL